jgi:inorganic pyrophosphatase
MNHKNIKPFNEKDNTINTIIEIPAHSNIKYELNNELGIIEVDRFSYTTMGYPCNYGLIPNTLGGDEDPLDTLVITRDPLHPGVMIKCKVIGLLKMDDEGGSDEKIICVPADKIDKFYKDVNSYEDLGEIELKRIEHFFEKYKDLEADKWVKISGWGTKEEALELIKSSIEKFKEENGL